MRRNDLFDDVAEVIVFEDEEFRRHLEAGNDGDLADRLAALLREYFARGERRGNEASL